MSKTIELTYENFEDEVINSDIPVLVDFWAPWCAPCRMMAPVLEDLSEEFKGKVKIGKLDTDKPEHQMLAIKYQIRSIPNMKLFKDGKVVKEFIGFRQKATLKSEIESELD